MHFSHLKRPFASAVLVVFSTLYMQPALAAAAHWNEYSLAKAEPHGAQVLDKAAVKSKLAKMPVTPAFTENKGQGPEKYAFYYKGKDHAVYFSKDRIVYQDTYPADNGRIARVVYEQKLGAKAEIVAEKPIALVQSEFIGKKRLSNIRSYERLTYKNLYPGIDLVFYFTSGTHALEYEYDLAPHADPSAVVSSFGGVKKVSVDANGNLVLATPVKDAVQTAPNAYQTDAAGEKVAVASAFKVLDGKKNSVGFTLGTYDAGLPLVIDPLLANLDAATYLGGQTEDIMTDIVVDASDSVYAVGYTNSSDFPSTTGYGTFHGSHNAVVAKFNSNLTTYVARALLAGTSSVAGDEGKSIALDSNGNVVVCGLATTTDFPVTTSRVLKGSMDMFASLLTSDLTTLSLSTLVGGDGMDQCTAVAVDDINNVIIAGYTPLASASTFPVTSGAVQETFGGGTYDMGVVKLSASSFDILKGTFLGGADSDRALGLASDSSGNIYVVGFTYSSTISWVSGYQTTCALTSTSNGCGLVVKLPSAMNAASASFLAGTDGDGDRLNGVAVDGSGNVYLAGEAKSSDFPTTGGAYQRVNNGVTNATVSKMNGSLSSLLASTYLGNDGNDSATDVVLSNSTTTVYVGGIENANTFPTTSGAYQTSPGGSGDFFVSEFNSGLTNLDASTLVGGTGAEDHAKIALDSSLLVYFVGSSNGNFPTTLSAAFPSYAGGSNDGVIGRLSDSGGPKPVPEMSTWILIATIAAGAGMMLKLKPGVRQTAI